MYNENYNVIKTKQVSKQVIQIDQRFEKIIFQWNIKSEFVKMYNGHFWSRIE